ncbi:phage tail protein [Pseudomonas viridiflava]|uniref:phage tail-collar fiber domain-containing protein n=1 Tax=Pseudomonas viridiflava TaxID=33069 RepID=UPI000F0590A9|nr:phage tail protein [Pseudomonas viridiflava]
MGASITLAGENLIAQKQGAKEALRIARFLFANVPGLDANAVVDRAAAKPTAAQIVYTYPLPDENAGYVNPNQVVYSSQLGSDVGDWDFNWIGLESDEGVLFAVSYVPLQQKRRNIPPLQIGNNVTRNFLVAFDGAQALTGITIDASTWQHDFTVRLAGIDERERVSNRDVYGRACFFSSSLQLEKVGTAYQLKPGTAYIEGIRLVLAAALPVAVAALPAQVWLDVVLQRELNDVVPTWKMVFGADKVDYTDTLGAKHYCVPIATVTVGGVVADLRSVEAINGPLVQQFALRTGDYAALRARATTKEDVKLGNIPNAISDDAEKNSSEILATTKAVKSLGTAIGTVIEKIISGITEVGKAAKLGTARKITLDGAVTGEVLFDGSTDVKLTAAAAQATEVVSGGAKVATQLQVNTGEDDTAYITSKKLRWGLVKGVKYIIFPTWMLSLKLVWGRLESVGLNQSFYAVTFPIAFTSEVFHINTVISRSTVISGAVATVIKPDHTLTGFEVAGDQDTNTSIGDIPWFAFGI